MSIRWGDSDSSDDEPPISASSLTRLHQERQEEIAYAPHLEDGPKKTWTQKQSIPNEKPSQARGAGRGGGSGGRSGGARGAKVTGGSSNNSGHQSHMGGSRIRNVGGGRGSGAGAGGAKTWKELAKSSSKFGKDSEINLDGGSWMAQRKARQQQQQQQNRLEEEKEKHKLEQEKRQRRKSQLQALKAAVQTIEETQPPVPVSSLQAASSILKPPPSPQPTKILKRNESEGIHVDTGSVTSLNSQSSGRGGRTGGRGGKGRHEIGRGRGRGYNSGDRHDSERSIDSHRSSGRGKQGHMHSDVASVHSDSGSHSSSRGKAGRESARSGHHHDGARGRGHGRNKQDGRGRGRQHNKGKLEPGKPQTVRTTSGTLEFHIDDKPKTEGKLMNNGTVRLSKKSGGRHHGNKNVTRSPIRTRLEVGAEKPE